MINTLRMGSVLLCTMSIVNAMSAKMLFMSSWVSAISTVRVKQRCHRRTISKIWFALTSCRLLHHSHDRFNHHLTSEFPIKSLLIDCWFDFRILIMLSCTASWDKIYFELSVVCLAGGFVSRVSSIFLGEIEVSWCEQWRDAWRLNSFQLN